MLNFHVILFINLCILWCEETDAGCLSKFWIRALQAPCTPHPSCNNHTESFFNILKGKFMNRKVHPRIETLLQLLVERVGPYFEEKIINRRSDKLSEKARASVFSKETKAEEIVRKGYVIVIDEILGIAIVQSSRDAAVHYHVQLKPPSCNCPDLDGTFCKHIRAVGRVLQGMESWGLGIVEEPHKVQPVVPLSPMIDQDTEDDADNHLDKEKEPNSQLSAAAQVLCSNAPLDKVHELQKLLTKVREFKNSDSEFFSGALGLMKNIVDLENDEALATFDEVQKIVWARGHQCKRKMEPKERKKTKKSRL